MHERTLDGIWWVPGQENAPVGGRLIFSPTAGPRLETIGQLLTDREASRSIEVPFVYGTVGAFGTGNEVTLVQSFLESRTTLGAHTTQSYVPDSVILGARVDHTRIARCRVSYTQLDPWLMEGGFDLDLGTEADDFEYRVTYRTRQLPVVRTSDFKLAFGFESAPPLQSHRRYPLREHVFAELTPDTPLDFNDFYLRYLWKLQNFLTFATDQPAAITYLSVWLGTSERPCEMLFKHPFPTSPVAHPVEMLFTYRDVANRLPDLFDSWFGAYADLGTALNQLFAAIYGDYKLTDTRFLALMQAAESYHRRKYPVSTETLSQHEQRIVLITSLIPEEHVKWLTGKLQYAYEPFLAKRLTALFARMGNEFLKPMFSTPRERKRTVRDMVEWRNKLTHLTATPQEINDGLYDLHVFANQLLTVLKASVLLDLGFTHGDLENCFRYNRIYRQNARRPPRK